MGLPHPSWPCEKHVLASRDILHDILLKENELFEREKRKNRNKNSTCSLLNFALSSCITFTLGKLRDSASFSNSNPPSANNFLTHSCFSLKEKGGERRIWGMGGKGGGSDLLLSSSFCFFLWIAASRLRFIRSRCSGVRTS